MIDFGQCTPISCVRLNHAVRVLDLLIVHIKSLLDASALVLAIVNGVFLLKFYLRDRPKLTVRPINPRVYQWWFRMPDGEHNGENTRRFGFLAYVEILNTGLRKTELDSWWLCFQTASQGQHRLEPFNMPEPAITIGELEKHYPVLGQKGLMSDGRTLTEPGCSVTGMVFFEYECYGSDSWNPAIEAGKVSATFGVESVFGKTCRCDVEFSEKSLEEIREMAPGIDLTSKT
jgi:hypothetical protein